MSPTNVWPLLRVMLVGTMVWLPGCTGIQQGPPVDLAKAAEPTVVSDPPPSPPTPPPSPPTPAPRQGFKVWIPRVVTPNGDVHDGHYVELSDKAPQKELRKPDYDIPKVPRQVYRPPPKASKPAGAGSSEAPAVRQPGFIPGTALPFPFPETPHELP